MSNKPNNVIQRWADNRGGQLAIGIVLIIVGAGLVALGFLWPWFAAIGIILIMIGRIFAF